jgi:serine/threonine protein kinase
MDIKSNFKIDFKIILDTKEFYTLYKGIDKKTKKKIIAKKIDFKKELNNDFENLNEKEINNIRIMNLSNNSHRYINHYIENNNLFIIYENYDNNLDSIIDKTKFSIDKIKDIISQLNGIFKLLYDKNIHHLDIKPSNILIKEEKNNIIYLLGNYGFFNIQQKYLLNNKNNKDYAYIPPEIKLNSSNDLNKSDLWSIGILLYYLYFQNYPFKNEEEYLAFISNNNEKLDYQYK